MTLMTYRDNKYILRNISMVHNNTDDIHSSIDDDFEKISIPMNEISSTNDQYHQFFED